MPSFDVVSEVDLQEMDNALNQARKELQQRYDLKQTRSEINEEKKGEAIQVVSDNDFTLKQVIDVLTSKMSKRGIPLENLRFEKIEPASDARVKQTIKLQQGIPAEEAKKIAKLIKDTKMKVQAQIQGDQVRVTGKKRDDLQEAIALLRGKQEELGLALQFTNFRD